MSTQRTVFDSIVVLSCMQHSSQHTSNDRNGSSKVRGSFYGSMLRGLLKFPLTRSGVATVFVINVSGSIKFP